MWAQCIKRFPDAKEMERHLDRHASHAIMCAYVGERNDCSGSEPCLADYYQDCDEGFRRPRDLVRHNQLEHANASLRPAVVPYKPAVPASMGKLPRTLPAHLVEPRDVRNPSIPYERHVALGEWVRTQILLFLQRTRLSDDVTRQVLRNIAGPVDVGPKRMGEALHTGYYDYDFLGTGGSHAKKRSALPQLDDLQSSITSRLISDGMTLWGSDHAQDDNWALVSEEVEAELANAEMEWVEMDVESSTSAGADEQAVELLLTGHGDI